MATLSQNITQAISDFADIKTAIEAKGVTVPSGTPTSDYDSLIADIPTGGTSYFDELKTMIEKPNSGEIVFTIPSGITKIGQHAFYKFSVLWSVTIPSGVTNIGSSAFYNCGALRWINFPEGLLTIGDDALGHCSRLRDITLPSTLTDIGRQAFADSGTISTGIDTIAIPHGLTALGERAFQGCTKLATVSIPNTITTMGNYVFNQCTALTNVTIENGFNCNNLYLASSTQFSHDTILSWFNALADRTGETAYTLNIGSTNINKMTSQEIAIVTNKNWNLA